MVFVILAFIGFESAAPLAEEARRPRWTVPQAVVGSASIVGLFYVLCSYAWVVGTGFPHFTETRFAQANPWRHLGEVFWSAGWVLIFFAIVNSALANANAGTNAVERVLFAMARNGVLPSALARTHPVHRTPHVAIDRRRPRFGISARAAARLEVGPADGFGIIATAVTRLVIVRLHRGLVACDVYYWREKRAEWNWLAARDLPRPRRARLPRRPSTTSPAARPDYPLRFGN